MKEEKLGPQRKTRIVSWAVFLVTLILVLISLIPVVFPALLLKTFGGFEDHIGINPFEIGIWAAPFLITNLVLLCLGIFYLKNILPKQIVNSIKFIFNFEVPSSVAFLVITILLGFYILSSVNELSDEFYLPDYNVRVKSWIENYSITEVGNWGLGNHLNIFLLSSSTEIFGNDKVIPYIASIALLLLTYLTTFEITKKRFAGIVALVIVLQSGIFLMYDTSVSYPNFWVVFYLLSIYLIYKKTPVTVLAYAASLLSKAITVLYLPMTIFFIYRAKMKNAKKIRLLIYYVVFMAIIVIFLSVSDVSLFGRDLGEEIGSKYVRGEFSSHDFWGGFGALHSSLRLDGLLLVFLLPLIVGLFIASRKGIEQADAILFFLMSILISAPFIQGFSDFINTPYRFIPLVVFFAIGVGVLVSKRPRVASE